MNLHLLCRLVIQYGFLRTCRIKAEEKGRIFSLMNFDLPSLHIELSDVLESVHIQLVREAMCSCLKVHVSLYPCMVTKILQSACKWWADQKEHIP